MNYVAHLKAFSVKRKQTPISANGLALYYTLCEFDNELGWMDWFTICNTTLQGLSGLSLSALKRARGELATKGFIKYREGTGNQAGKYLIVRFEPQTEPQSEPQSDPQTEPQSEPQVSHKVDTLNKLNQTKPNSKEKDNKKKFVPPTVEEVKAYCAERKNNVNAEKFVSYYSSNGWMVGRNKMRDWKAAVRTWEKNNFDKPTPDVKPSAPSSYDLSAYQKNAMSKPLEYRKK